MVVAAAVRIQTGRIRLRWEFRRRAVVTVDIIVDRTLVVRTVVLVAAHNTTRRQERATARPVKETMVA